MTKMSITREAEEKRLRDFRKIAENWEVLLEYARGKLDGIISATAALCGTGFAEQQDSIPA